MKKNLFLFFVLCLMIPVKGLFAQSIADTIETAKYLRNEKKFKDAFVLLKQYYTNHPKELNAAWLCAQTACWMKHFKTSESIYEDAIRIHPDNYYLKLDYAEMLVNIGEFEKAKPLLNTYLNYDSTNMEALISLSKILYWQGNYREAINGIRKILHYDPKNKNASALRDEIFSAKSPWIKLNAGYTIDNQPMQNINPSIEGGLYLNSLASPHFNFQMPVFKQNGNVSNALWFQAGNKSLFGKAGLKLDIDAGLLKFSYKDIATWTGNFKIAKTFIRYLIISAQTERKPYFYTLSSLDTSLIEKHSAVSADWNNPKSWYGKATFEVNRFPDNNFTTSFSAWIFAPPLKVSVFEFRIGYGNNFSTSKENRFTSEKSLSEIIADFNSSEKIIGVYNPYFTPNNQQTHSALAAISIHPLKILNIGINASYGFYAVAHNPYLYLDKDATGNTMIVKNYFRKSYSPMELSAYMTVQVTKKISFKTEYLYSNTNFYINNYMGLELKMSFGNE